MNTQINQEVSAFRIVFINTKNQIVAIEGFKSENVCIDIINDYPFSQKFRNDSLIITQLYQFLDKEHHLGTKFQIEHLTFRNNNPNEPVWCLSNGQESMKPNVKVVFGKLGYLDEDSLDRQSTSKQTIYNQSNLSVTPNFTY